MDYIIYIFILSNSGTPLLETLLLNGNDYIADDSFATLSQLFHLRIIDVVKCRRFTDLSLQRLEDGCPSLEIVYLGMNKTSDPGVEHLQRTRPALVIIDRSRYGIYLSVPLYTRNDY